MMAKKMKKLFALVLALSMVMSLLSVTAFAEDEGDGDGGSAVPAHNQVTCSDCGGTGCVLEDCPDCEEGVILTPCIAEGCDNGRIMCTTCNGTGEIPCYYCGGEGCMGCNGTGVEPCNCEKGYVDCKACEGGIVSTPCTAQGCENGVIDTGEACPTCEGTGKADCTGSFDAGRLSAVDKETGAGTIHYSCAVCGAAYDETLAAADTARLLAEGLNVTFTVNSAKASAGAKIVYTLKITNNNPVNVSNLTARVLLDGNLGFTSTKSNPAISGSYKGSPSPSYKDATAAYQEADGAVDLTIPGIVSGKSIEVNLTAKVKADVVLGENLNTALSVSLMMGDGEEPVTLPVQNAATHINKYKAATVYLCGGKLGGWYDPSDRRTTPPFASAMNHKGASLDDYEGAVLSFESAFNSEANPATGVMLYSRNETYCGATVNNQFDNRIWHCVGFVPCGGHPEELEELGRFIYIDTNENDPAFQQGTLEDAQKAVTDAGGVLYGGTADEAFMQKLESAIQGGSVAIMCVWYVEPEAPLTIGTYGDLSIKQVNPIDYQATSGGVTVRCGEITCEVPGHYDAELIVTIGADAPNDINVNLTEAIRTLKKTIVEEYSSGNSIEPGDSIRYHITLVNSSGRNYQYRSGSAALGTVNFGGENTLGDGFEGYPISKGFEAEMGGKTVLISIIPRRILNDPLKFLGAAATDGSDEVIGALLEEKGYGRDEGLTGAEITQKYLGRFYLDYLNKFVKDGEEKTASFQALTESQMHILTNGDSMGTAETCRDVAEAFYYFYNGRAWLFNGLSLYDQMKDNSQLDSGFAAAAAAGVPFVLDANMGGFHVPNAFQDTVSGFGMQFKMYVPTSGGGGDTPTPPPTPDPGTEIPDPDVPTGDQPDTPAEPERPVDIDDPAVPLSEAPKTGDLLGLWLALAGISGMGLTGIRVTGRKKERDD